jgi:broad specificity phosphatase PhoE
MEILLCRHGETNLNIVGKTHLPDDEAGLNDVGRIQASKLALVAAEHTVQEIFCSPERRAIETAQIVGQPLSLKLTVIDSLKERNWGDWNGEPWNKIELKLKDKTLNERYTFVPPHGESWEQMQQRLKRTVDNIVLTVNGNIMIVTHGGALRALVPVLKHEELARSLSYNFDNTSVTSFLYSHPASYKLLTENDTSHI